MNFRFSHEALNDLDTLLLMEAERTGWEHSMDVEAKLWESFALLGRTPGIGHLRQDLIEGGLCFHYAKPYMIAYRRDIEPIVIIAVLHGARDIAAILSER